MIAKREWVQRIAITAVLMLGALGITSSSTVLGPGTPPKTAVPETVLLREDARDPDVEALLRGGFQRAEVPVRRSSAFGPFELTAAHLRKLARKQEGKDGPCAAGGTAA